MTSLDAPFRIRNSTGAPIELWLEPAGDGIKIAPGEAVEVELYDGAGSDPLIFDVVAGGFTLGGVVRKIWKIEPGRGRIAIWSWE
jgi:hypothetical protein